MLPCDVAVAPRWSTHGVLVSLQQIAKRRAVLATAHLEAGQGFWLAKQRWLWRRGRLSREQFLMLQLAGLEMDIDPPMQWKRLAHEAAHYLNGFQINPDQARLLSCLRSMVHTPHMYIYMYVYMCAFSERAEEQQVELQWAAADGSEVTSYSCLQIVCGHDVAIMCHN